MKFKSSVLSVSPWFIVWIHQELHFSGKQLHNSASFLYLLEPMLSRLQFLLDPKNNEFRRTQNRHSDFDDEIAIDNILSRHGLS